MAVALKKQKCQGKCLSAIPRHSGADGGQFMFLFPMSLKMGQKEHIAEIPNSA